MDGRVNSKDVMFRRRWEREPLERLVWTMNGMPRAQEAQERLVSVLHGV